MFETSTELATTDTISLGPSFATTDGTNRPQSWPNQSAPTNRIANHLAKPRSTTERDGFGNYLADLGNSDLLNRSQERQLGKQIALTRTAFQRLILKEYAVVEHLLRWLQDYQTKQIRLDMLFDIALKDHSQRQVLEPRIKSSATALQRLLNNTSHADLQQSRLAARRFWFAAIRLIEPLNIRPKYFESAPFENPKATMLRNVYQKTCQSLASANLRLVISIARKLCRDSGQQMDLIQEGNRGLLHAVTKFDYRRDIRFSTYATQWIRKAMLEMLPNQNRIIRVPDLFRSKHQRFQNAQCHGSSHSQHGSLDHQMSENLQISFSDACRHLSVQRDTQSLDQAADNGNEKHLASGLLVDHRSDNPHLAAVKNEQTSILRRVVESLNHRERQVIECRFGLDDGVSRSLADVGKILKYSRERVRQIEKSALVKLASLVPASL